MGYGRGITKAWTSAEVSIIDSIIQSGVRRVYYPPAISGIETGHEWTFLHPNEAITTIVNQWEYDLPDNFGRLVGTLHFGSALYRKSIQVISAPALIDLRSSASMSDYPTYCATRYKISNGVNGQRQELLLFPTPSVVLTLSYEYEAYSGALTTSYPYPLGGMQMTELYIESCLAVAEGRMNDAIGEHTQQYQSLLADAIARDNKRGAVVYGQMGHHSVDEREYFRHGFTGALGIVTYKGVDI